MIATIAKADDQQIKQRDLVVARNLRGSGRDYRSIGVFLQFGRRKI
jgi:hypothetical protein